MLRLYSFIRHFCLLPSYFLTKYPVALEAVLRAEVTFFAQLLAVWTLQRASVILAVVACALARGVAGHDARRNGNMKVCSSVEVESQVSFADSSLIWLVQLPCTCYRAPRESVVIVCLDFNAAHSRRLSEFQPSNRRGGPERPLRKSGC
jgi:hypothetical protein